MENSIPVPQVGDDIYIPDQDGGIYGGLAKIIRKEVVTGGKSVHEFTFEEIPKIPGKTWYWEGYLADMQEELKNRFNNLRAWARSPRPNNSSHLEPDKVLAIFSFVPEKRE